MKIQTTHRSILFTLSTVLIVATVLFHGCKKEIQTSEADNPDKPLMEFGLVKYEDFKREIRLDRLGTLRSAFEVKDNNKGIVTVKSQSSKDLKIILSNIMRLERNGHIVYSFPLELINKRASSFQNIVIDQSDSETIATLVTYVPDSSWSVGFNKNEHTAFYGQIKIDPIEINGDKGIKFKKKFSAVNTISTIGCNYYAVFDGINSIPCGCPEQHSIMQYPICECPVKPSANGNYSWVEVCGDEEKIILIPSGGGGGSEGGGGGGTIPTTYPPNFEPCTDRSGCGEGNPYIPTRIAWIMWVLDLSLEQTEALLDAQYVHFTSDLYNALKNQTSLSSQRKAQLLSHVNLVLEHPSYLAFTDSYYSAKSTGEYLWWEDEGWLDNSTNIAAANSLNLFEFLGMQGTSTDYDVDADEGSFTTTGYDQATYPTYNPADPFPVVDDILASNAYRGFKWDGSTTNCMTLAKQQLALAGYQQSGPTAGQYWNTYTEPNTVNASNAADAISYMLYALQAGIPVIVGVDHNLNKGINEGTTDHFIVIVGCGNDANGKYFRYYDNATGTQKLGRHTENKLHYNTTTGAITAVNGTRAPSAAKNNWYNYKVSQVRKSKVL